MAEMVHGMVCSCAHRRVLIVGELHGTNETPDLVASLVKEVAASRSVRLGLEISVSEADAICAYLNSPGRPQDVANLLKGQFWSGSGIRDGRSSFAMLRLIEHMRVLRAHGLDVDVFEMQPDYSDSAAIQKDGGYLVAKESGMAQSIRRTLGHGKPDLLVIALMGNFHARYDEAATRNDVAHGSVVERLADISPYVVLPSASQTSAWNCQSDGCGVHSTNHAAPSMQLLLSLSLASHGRAGPTVVTLALDKQTASMPVVRAASDDGAPSAAH